MTNGTPISPDKDLLLTLVTLLSAALRARSDPEHLYTAASLGSFGAVAWGVAALNPQDYLSRPVWSRPATIAAVGTLIVAASVAVKIYREHRRYAEIKAQLIQISKLLESLPGNNGIIPKEMREPAGRGDLYSLAIVIAAAVAAVGFCLSRVGG